SSVSDGQPGLPLLQRPLIHLCTTPQTSYVLQGAKRACVMTRPARLFGGRIVGHASAIRSIRIARISKRPNEALHKRRDRHNREAPAEGRQIPRAHVIEKVAHEAGTSGSAPSAGRL